MPVKTPRKVGAGTSISSVRPKMRLQRLVYRAGLVRRANETVSDSDDRSPRGRGEVVAAIREADTPPCSNSMDAIPESGEVRPSQAGERAT